jgi:hypothetical protein
VIVVMLPAGGAAFVAALQRGRDLGDAAAHAQASCAEFDLSATLTLLLGRGALSSIHLPAR